MEKQHRTSNESLTKILLRQLKKIWTMLNDRFLNIQTIQESASAPEAVQKSELSNGTATRKAKHDDNKGYAGFDYYWIRKCRDILNPGPTDVFYDLGSGMGRVVCIFAQKELKKCVGVEFVEDLCDISRRNAEKLSGRKSPIEIRCEDVTQSDLSDGTIFFLFNPFGPATLKDVLTNLEHSLCSNSRHVKIAYFNPVHIQELEQCKWLRKYHELHTFHGYAISFWENIDTAKELPRDIDQQTGTDASLNRPATPLISPMVPPCRQN